MLESIRAIWKPAMYHGFGKRRRFFEGWYFRCVSPTGDAVYAIIPGVSLGADGESHAFIQILNGLERTSSYHRYELSEFSSARDRFAIRIGPNRFSLDGISLDVAAEVPVKGELHFRDLHPWPVRCFSPGVMGWYALVPAMECYHGVLSFNHRIDGKLAVGGQCMDFTGGKGYIEKDWGRSFPKAWIWIQTNNFDEPDACLTASVAHIPWLGSSFTGHIVGLWIRGRLYRFATYTGARVSRLAVSPDVVMLTVEDRRNLLEIRCRRQEGGVLSAPNEGEMTGRITEAMTAAVDLTLTAKSGGSVSRVFTGTGSLAGLEVVGDVDLLLPGPPLPPSEF
jgi:tocopherol cyclase